ncbi:MAG: zinc-binding dehydrogenase [Opitutaceae bacterium]|jgi:NADPH:quinone reductase-like Zn-dependent oxidoreductase
MRAIHLTAINELSLAEVTVPEPVAGEVRVRLKAAALNHRDVWIKHGQYAGLKYPAQPGSDGSGVVEGISTTVDPEWIGREVIINPSFGWGDNESVQGADFSILGLPREGTLAEFVNVPVSQLTPKPEHLSWIEAAALPLAGLTGYRALFSRARLQPGEKVLINGVGGGVALFALQFAVAHGAEVYATSGSDDKINRAIGLGAAGGFNYTHTGWAKTAAHGHAERLFDVIVESAGGEGFESLLDLAAPGGRVVFFGATRGNPPVLAMRKVFWRQLSLLGTTMGSPTDWEAMIAFVARHRIAPVVHDVFPLENAAEAFALMERGEQFGKIVVSI